MRQSYRIEWTKPKIYGETERAGILAIRRFRHEAAKLYKFDKSPAKRLAELRSKYFKSDSNYFLQLVNKKYGVCVDYDFDKISERCSALAEYKEKLKAKRSEIRQINSDINEYGFDSVQSLHPEPNGIIKGYQMKLLMALKKPISGEMHIGVEIECGWPKDSTLEALMPFAKQISIGSDGSIHNLPSGYAPQEVRLLTTIANYKADLEKLCDTLATMKAIVNDTCGLHVHLDMRNVDSALITQYYVNLVKSQKYLQGLVTEKRRVNTYCKPTRCLDPYKQSGRYFAINGEALRKYQTLEVRLHHGTVDPKEIQNWITLLLGIIKADPIKRAAPTLKSFMAKLDIEEPVKQYVEERLRSNSPVTPATLPAEEFVESPAAAVGEHRPQIFRATSGCGHFHESSTEMCFVCNRNWDMHDHHRCHEGSIGYFVACAAYNEIAYAAIHGSQQPLNQQTRGVNQNV